MSSNKKMDWKFGGQMMAIMVRLFSTIIAVFKERSIGPEILDWLDGRGQEFLKTKLSEMSVSFEEYKSRLIDCDVAPYCPYGWSVESHRKTGTIEWSADNVDPWLSDSQKNGKVVGGEKLRKEIEKLDGVMNANVLDHLLANPHLIPEEWKGKAVFFWGTIYRGDGGNLCVRCLYWFGDAWDWSDNWLDNDFNDYDPAARVRK